MALTSKGGVLFDENGVVFEGPVTAAALGITAGSLNIGVDDIADAGDAGKAILALDEFGAAGEILATNAGADGVEWVVDDTGA